MMFGSEILDVAIGLIMLFLLVSLISSSIKEALETVLNHRAKDLERGLREMLGDLKRENFIPELYKHPLIDGLFRGKYVRGKTGNLPSYIPSRTFALALIDIVAQRKAAGTLASTAGAATQSQVVPTLEMFRDAVTALPENSHVRGALLPIIAVAQDDGTRLQLEMERWYNATMDRVSGWYKKRTQMMLALIGISLAVAMNVDTVAVVRYLNTSQTARQIMIARIEHYREAHPNSSSGNEPGEVSDPMGWLERQGGVPLGWVTTRLENQSLQDYQHDWRRLPTNWSEWLFKIAGLLLTGFAVTLGAPFWFDILNRFMVVRSTVKPDEKSQNEKSKS